MQRERRVPRGDQERGAVGRAREFDLLQRNHVGAARGLQPVSAADVPSVPQPSGRPDLGTSPQQPQQQPCTPSAVQVRMDEAIQQVQRQMMQALEQREDSMRQALVAAADAGR